MKKEFFFASLSDGKDGAWFPGYASSLKQDFDFEARKETNFLKVYTNIGSALCGLRRQVRLYKTKPRTHTIYVYKVEVEGVIGLNYWLPSYVAQLNEWAVELDEHWILSPVILKEESIFLVSFPSANSLPADGSPFEYNTLGVTKVSFNNAAT
jgi:hypothetical protein